MRFITFDHSGVPKKNLKRSYYKTEYERIPYHVTSNFSKKARDQTHLVYIDAGLGDRRNNALRRTEECV